MIFNDRSLKM